MQGRPEGSKEVHEEEESQQVNPVFVRGKGVNTPKFETKLTFATI